MCCTSVGILFAQKKKISYKMLLTHQYILNVDRFEYTTCQRGIIGLDIDLLSRESSHYIYNTTKVSIRSFCKYLQLDFSVCSICFEF